MNKVLTWVLVGQDKSLSNSTRSAANNVESASKKMQTSLRKAAVAFGVLAAAGTGMAIKMAKDYQAAMQKIVGLVGVSQKQVDQWSKQILALASTLPQSPKELADAMFFVTSAGLRGTKAMDVLTTSARAAASGLGDTKTVADAVTSAMNAYAKHGLKAKDVTDTITAAVTAGKMPVEDLTASIGQVLPVASEMGIKFSEVAATAAAMSRVGAPVQNTMTGIRYLLTSLEKPTVSVTKLLAKFGYSADDLRKSLRDRGLLATLKELHDKLPVDAFLQVVGGARGVSTALGLVGQNSKQVTEVFKDVDKSAGATDRAFKSASQTADFKLNSALSSLQAAAINLGSALLPIVAKIADAFSKLLAPIAQNKAAFAILAGGVMAFAVTSKIAMTLFATSVRAALVTSVVGIAILALTVAITALLTHWNTVWGAIKDVTQTVCDVIKTAFNAVKDFIIGKFIHPVVAAYLNFAGWMIHAAAKAFGWIPGLGGKLKDAAKAFDRFKDNVNSSLDKLQGKQVPVALQWSQQGGSFIGVGNIYGKAAGGPVKGPGTTTSDSILTRLSNEEYVVNASAHRFYGTGFLNALNAKKLASGGVALRTFLPSMKSVNAAIGDALSKTAISMANRLLSAMTVAGTGVQRWAGLVLQVLALLHQSPAWLGTVLRRMNQESGGNPYAVNLWDVNAARGTPSMGLMQVISPTFAAYANGFSGLGIFNPLANIFAGLNYALHRYGSLAALNRPGGYDSGGILRPGYTLAYNGTGHNEYVMNPARVPVVNYYVTVEVRGQVLASKQEIGRTISEALAEFKRKGGKLP